MFEKIKSNKYLLYGGAIIALIGVFLILRGATGGSASQVVQASGPTDAQVNAQTQLALAQISANAAQNQTNGQIAVQTMQVQAGLTATQIQADLQRYAITQDSQNQQMQISYQSVADQRNAELQAQVAKWTLDQALAVQSSNNAFQLDYAQAANSSAIAMANIQAGVVNNQLMVSQNVTIASLQSQAAQLASYLGAQVTMNESNNAKDVTINGQNQSTVRRGQTTSLIGSIAGGLFGLFSDERLKSDIVLLGCEADGVGVYSYRYNDSETLQIGYMADEIERLRPWAMGPVIEGYKTVNYQAA